MEDTKARILDAALELFADKGYSAVSTKCIARAAGVNEVTLFRIFGSKRNLYQEVYNRFSVKISAQTIRNGLRYDLEYDLASMGRSFVSVYNETSKLVRMSMKDVREEFGEIDDDLKRQIDAMTAIFASYFREMQERGRIRENPERLAEMLTGLLYGYAFHLSKRNVLDRLETDISEFMVLLVNGIRKPRARRRPPNGLAEDRPAV